MLSILECCNSHIRNVQAVLSRERARHGLGPSELEPWVERLEREYAAADYLACPSEYVRASFLERGFAPHRLLLLPYGADLERFKPRTGPHEGPFRVLFAGFDMLRKGAHILFQAWRDLAPRDAELVVCGQLELSFARRFRGLMPRLRLEGKGRDIERLYAEVDLVVLPTFEAGFGLVIVEAMAAGVPVVTTAHSSGPDLIEDGRDGFIVPVGDASALRDRLEYCLARRDDMAALGRNARQKAAGFNWDRRALSLYEGLLALTPKP